MAYNCYEGKDFSAAYARFRPTYPKELFDAIMDYHRKSVSKSASQCGFTTAIDLGCGTGQATQPLIKYFTHVTGVDVSPTQIEAARREFPDISFHVGRGEDLRFLPDNSVDLVTVSTALHWMDANLVYPEVKRVLKSGATIAVFKYSMPRLTIPEANMEFNQVWRETLWNYWDTKKVSLSVNDYKDLEFPFAYRERVEDIAVTKLITLDELIGFISSLVSWNAFQKVNPNSDLLEKTKVRLQAVLNKQSGTSSPVVEMQLDYVLLLGRKDDSRTS